MVDEPAVERVDERIVELVQRLGVASQGVAHAFAAAQGLHPTDLEALLHVLRADQRGEPMTAGELTAALGLTSGAITGVVDRLERAGHLERRRDAHDRRRVLLHHGAPGRAVAAEFFAPLARLTDRVVGSFTPAELGTVDRFLVAMVEAMAEHAGKRPS